MKHKLRAPLRFIEALLDIVANFVKKLFVAILLAFLSALVLGTAFVFLITQIAN